MSAMSRSIETYSPHAIIIYTVVDRSLKSVRIIVLRFQTKSNLLILLHFSIVICSLIYLVFTYSIGTVYKNNATYFLNSYVHNLYFNYLLTFN